MRFAKLAVAAALLFASVGLVSARAAAAAEPAGTSAPGAQGSAAATSPTRAEEIRAALDEGERAIAALCARLPRAASTAEATDLKRRIARAKLEIEARVLRVQASWARREGREDLARRLDAEAVALLAPRPRDAAAAARRGPVR